MTIKSKKFNLSEIIILDEQDIEILEPVLKQFSKNGEINGVRISDDEIVIKEELDDFILNHPNIIKEYEDIADMVYDTNCCYIFNLK